VRATIGSGSNVISYATPLGRNLLGTRVGDRVSVVGTDIVHDYVIRSIEMKHPETPGEIDEADVSAEDLDELVESLGIGDEETDS